MARIAVTGDKWVARILYGFDFSTVSPAKSIKHVNAPILLVHGTADARTPFSDSQALAAAKPDTTELWLVDGAAHVRSFATHPDEYSARLVKFFGSH